MEIPETLSVALLQPVLHARPELKHFPEMLFDSCS